MPAPSAPVRDPIYCGCCGTAILAERVDDAIVIKAKRNGRFHVAVVQCVTVTPAKGPQALSGAECLTVTR